MVVGVGAVCEGAGWFVETDGAGAADGSEPTKNGDGVGGVGAIDAIGAAVVAIGVGSGLRASGAASVFCSGFGGSFAQPAIARPAAATTAAIFAGALLAARAQNGHDVSVA